jgi:hypothetical protein
MLQVTKLDVDTIPKIHLYNVYVRLANWIQLSSYPKIFRNWPRAKHLVSVILYGEHLYYELW